MIKVLLINNFDSFVYNIKQILDESNICETEIVLNTNITTEYASQFDKIILSPGPGLPKDTSNVFSIIDTFYKTKSILGVCLGFQSLVEYFGGELIQLKKIYHGHKSELTFYDNDEIIFKNCHSPIYVGRYHSWAANIDNFPEILKITSIADDVIMSFRHLHFDISGVLFHPESIITTEGQLMINNWLHN